MIRITLLPKHAKEWMWKIPLFVAREPWEVPVFWLPLSLGAVSTGYRRTSRLDRLLSVGHRFRGDVGVA